MLSTTSISVLIHAGAIALLLIASTQIAPRSLLKAPTQVTPLIAPYLPHLSLPAMGGGGGAHQAAPATEGHLPKIAPRQFVPPTLEILNPHPKLAMEMTIEAPPDAALLNNALPNLGNPLSGVLTNSGGSGGPLGIGSGHGTGVGDKRGPGAGNGDNIAGTVYRPGKGITLPVLIHSVEPEFSEEARRAKHAGIVKLRADIDATGHPRNLQVVQSLGMGLDEKALEAVAQWLFKAGMKDGKPVAVSALVEVSFHLL